MFLTKVVHIVVVVRRRCRHSRCCRTCHRRRRHRPRRRRRCTSSWFVVVVVVHHCCRGLHCRCTSSSFVVVVHHRRRLQRVATCTWSTRSQQRIRPIEFESHGLPSPPLEGGVGTKNVQESDLGFDLGLRFRSGRIEVRPRVGGGVETKNVKEYLAMGGSDWSPT